MIVYRTRSGSIYHVDGLLVRRVHRSELSCSERVADEWREAVEISCEGVGHPIVITWGTGLDEHSPPGPEDRLRTTITTPVVEATIVMVD